MAEDPATAARRPPERVRIVVNPVSGRGRGLQAGDLLAQAFARRGVAVELCRTRPRSDAPGPPAGAVDLVVAVGGDGTLGEVLAGLADARTPVGLFPCGTANVLARVLRLPARVPEALEAFLHAGLRRLDVARVGTRLSHLVTGVGMDARAVHAVERRRRGPIRKWDYVAAGLSALRRSRPVPLRVEIDGEERAESAGLVWVSNAPRYADLLRLSPEARIDDGRWEVYLFPTGRRREVLAGFLRGFVAHLPGGAVRMRTARSVRIEAPEPVPCQVDGDLAGTTPVALEVLPERFRLVVPGSPTIPAWSEP
jgi:YegS/Rv2252/BmrU family lipid kinase